MNIELASDVKALLQALHSAGHGVALVGGSVRDVLLGRPLHDLDVVTDASPADVRAVCATSSWCRRIYDVGERYGTIGVVLESGGVVEVSRVRVETPGDTPFAAAFGADAVHRDLTVNAIAAVWPTLELLDPAGGLADITGRVLRAPGDPAERLSEDPLRVLRAARFVAELGFRLDPGTEGALASSAPALRGVAPERVRDELSALLMAPHVGQGLDVLQRCGILAQVLPEVACLDGLAQPSFHDLDALTHTLQAVAIVPASLILRWATLLHDVGKAPARSIDAEGRIRFLRHAQLGAEIAGDVCQRLRFSNAERVAIVHLVREHMRLGEMPLDNPRAVDRAVRRLDVWAAGANPPRRIVSAEDAIELELADFAATAHREEAPARRRLLEAAISTSRERGTRRPPATPLSGREIMGALEVSEGPPVGAALRAIEDAVAEGRIGAGDRAAALEIARKALG